MLTKLKKKQMRVKVQDLADTIDVATCLMNHLKEELLKQKAQIEELERRIDKLNEVR